MRDNVTSIVRTFAPEGIGIQNPLVQRLAGQYALGIITYLEFVIALEFIDRCHCDGCYPDAT